MGSMASQYMKALDGASALRAYSDMEYKAVLELFAAFSKVRRLGYPVAVARCVALGLGNLVAQAERFAPTGPAGQPARREGFPGDCTFLRNWVRHPCVPIHPPACPPARR
jgi:hypothetical protein